MSDVLLPFPFPQPSDAFPLHPLSSVCRRAWCSGRRLIPGSLSSTPLSSPERTALGLTALPSPSLRRWPVSRSAVPCRLYTTCTTQSSTTSCTLPPHHRDPKSIGTNTPRHVLCSTPHPPSPACSASTRTTSVATRCTCQSASASWHPWPSLRPAGRCWGSFIRLCRPLSLHPSHWRASSTTSSMRCPCHPLGVPSSSQACTGPWCARGRAHLSCRSLTFPLVKCLLSWGWKTFFSCSPVPCSRCRYYSTRSVSSRPAPVTLDVYMLPSASCPIRVHWLRLPMHLAQIVKRRFPGLTWTCKHELLCNLDTIH